MNPKDITIVICCAGMGTRLGIGTTKALINIKHKPLIIHQLDQLKDYDDIRIVVGFQAENVISVVKEYRKDVMFAFNYNYEETGPAASMSKGIIGARKYVVVMDGDVLINSDDFRKFLEYPGECLPHSNITSDEPIYVNVQNENVVSFSTQTGDYEWPCIAKLKSENLEYGDGFIYNVIKPKLPIKTINIRSREIDTPDDYENAVKWMENECLN